MHTIRHTTPALISCGRRENVSALALKHCTGTRRKRAAPTEMRSAFKSARSTQYSTERDRSNGRPSEIKLTACFRPRPNLSFAPFDSKKLGHEFIEDTHRN